MLPLWRRLPAGRSPRLLFREREGTQTPGGTPVRRPVRRPQMRDTTKTTRKRKNSTRAISAEPEAMPPNPNTAAMIRDDEERRCPAQHDHLLDLQ